jgi:hypothetical protein
MSPTIFYEESYRFFFFSREEKRIHVHVVGTDGEAKFWLEPTIVLAGNHGLSSKDLVKIEAIIKERKDEIESCWRKHFKS